MAESLLQKVQNEAKSFVTAPIYPFLQKDWWAKMWIFAVLAYVPLVNVIIARGWRMDYVRRIGWHEQRVLPSARDWLAFFGNGVLLWLATFAFLSLPLLIILPFGLDSLLGIWGDLLTLLSLLADYFFFTRMPTADFLRSLWSFIIGTLLSEIIVFLIENIWLVLYIPIYRIGTIRFALTGKLLQSHASLRKNLRFLFRNFVDIVLMYSFNIFNVVLFITLSSILSFTVIGIPLIPIITFFMPYWNSGYEYGLLARMMVEQEGLVRAPHAGVTPALAGPIALSSAPPVPTFELAAESPTCSACSTLDTGTSFCMQCGARLRGDAMIG